MNKILAFFGLCFWIIITLLIILSIIGMTYFMIYDNEENNDPWLDLGKELLNIMKSKQ